MSNTAYYNEIDPQKAEWLRNLIAAGHIAPGDVDERSIEDVAPDDVRKYAQCHFFAGVGLWSLALRNAGWEDTRPVWTLSCPCQPFSSAGKGAGFKDDRHLWPSGMYLIGQCRPSVLFGEQVASKDGLAWLDVVQADLEGAHYACGAIDTCAAGFGAPHIRQRLYFTAYDTQSASIWMGNTASRRSQSNRDISPSIRQETEHGFERYGSSCRLADAKHVPSATNGYWRDADWLFSWDNKWRPVEPGTFPLANVGPARLVRLRAYGDGIVVAQATEIIKAVME